MGLRGPLRGQLGIRGGLGSLERVDGASESIEGGCGVHFGGSWGVREH